MEILSSGPQTPSSTHIPTQPRGSDPKKKKPQTNKHANKQGKGQKQREKKGLSKEPNAQRQRLMGCGLSKASQA